MRRSFIFKSMSPFHLPFPSDRAKFAAMAIAVCGALLTVTTPRPAGAQIPFSKHVTASSFDGAASVHAADVDDDGDIDILGCAFYGDELVLWLNPGDGSPTGWPATIIDGSFDGAHFVNTADLDDDGDLDIVAVAQLAGEVAWWRNDGGTPIVWTRLSIDDAYAGAQQVYPVDMDDDDDLDLVCCAYLIDDVSWYRNEGGDPIAWSKHLISDSVPGVVSAWVVDMDSDLDMDVLSASYDLGRISWWRNDGDSSETWTRQYIDVDYTGAHEVRAADVDGDGDMDILGAAYSLDDITWWRNDGGDPVVWTELTIAGHFNGASSVAGADLDADGDMDVIGAANDAGKIVWWSNEGGDPIVWTRLVIDDFFAEAWPIVPVDINQDGHLDVLAGGRTIDEVAWYENGTAVSIPPAAPPLAARIESVFPNPFNPNVSISFSLDRAAPVRLEIFDPAGRAVALMADGLYQPGRYGMRWHGKDRSGRPVASGIYLLRLTAGPEVDSERLILIR